MDCSARTEQCVTENRTRDRQAAVLFLRSADAADDTGERDDLRRLAALLVLPRPE